ncbi:N(4)-(beta-N-acetylglucosaminyl)-L-asparaginase [Vagococcus zengguangii]|uniref:N(4)-(Beta-N-acetylglucosaminyl)-L-asparaginase n=1 Tax=Vagococcus zengguangii TaxID=2571750 RepID=A0A4D7CVZ3_9ENTE|nr:N(4)-(beta-N-acetylglucosaminyl)-L-asparaginase [Vagococcus zengguangii]QCI86196.1 N(4)-(beta-N-acetylglucosaminyl)-L-asparaginase [Vagococcus zengguangii]
MKPWGAIATWRMAHDGVLAAKELIHQQASAELACETLIKKVEDYPFYKSVGYGGLPNELGVLEMDAAFMNGDTMAFGGVASIQDIKNPISVARLLSKEKFNSFRVGEGAREFALSQGLEEKTMLTNRAKRIWEKRVEEIEEHQLDPYDGHDTVGAVTLDLNGSMVAGTSSSGLFMKKKGRVGDSPFSGSGLYVDSEIGGASATGLGEDLMKGCLSYEIVRLMGEGLSPQDACDKAVYAFDQKLKERYGKAGAMSLVALNNQGEWGVATNVEFTFSVATSTTEPTIYIAYPGPNQTTDISEVTPEWLEAYQNRITAPID